MGGVRHCELQITVSDTFGVSRSGTNPLYILFL